MQPREMVNARRDIAIDMHRSGKSVKEIALHLGIGIQSVYYYVSEEIQAKRLDNIRKAQELRAQGYSHYRIAKEFNRPISTVVYWLKDVG